MLTGTRSDIAEGDGIRSLVRNGSYTAILLTSLLFLWWGAVGPYRDYYEYTSIGLYVVMVVTILGLEFLLPYKPRWGDLRNVTGPDLGYFMLAPIIDQAQLLLRVALVAATVRWHDAMALLDWWPDQIHILWQLLLAFMVVDFFKYWYHRWTHEWPWLWRMHVIHHSLDRLQMLRASYFWPADILITVATGTLVLLLFGAPGEVVIFHNVFAGITGLMNHSNVDFECWPYDILLNTPGHHRQHHSMDDPGAHANYGSFFNLTDRMFGTRYLPEDPRDVGELGLDDSYAVPKTLLAQLAVPFRWKDVHKTT